LKLPCSINDYDLRDENPEQVGEEETRKTTLKIQNISNHTLGAHAQSFVK
jgi:hypothetical protein